MLWNELMRMLAPWKRKWIIGNLVEGIWNGQGQWMITGVDTCCDNKTEILRDTHVPCRVAIERQRICIANNNPKDIE